MVCEDRGLDVVSWGGEIWERVEVYIYPASMGTRDVGPIVIIRSGVSNAEVRDIRNHPEGKHRRKKNPIGEGAASCVHNPPRWRGEQEGKGSRPNTQSQDDHCVARCR